MAISNEDLIKKILKKKQQRSKEVSPTADTPLLTASGRKRGVLSSAQQRIYILSQMNGQRDVAYNLPEVLKLTGPLSMDQVQRAYDTVISRHDILRTAFVVDQGVVYQEVHDEVNFKVEEVSLDPHEFESWLASFIKPFDLRKPCLLRCALVTAGPNRFIVFDCHHIISDGFSSGLINRELAMVAVGQRLDRPKFQYLDYVHWDQQAVASAAYGKQESHWVTKLSGHLPVLSLPTDHPRPERKDFIGNTVEFSLGSRSGALRSLFRSERVTLFTGLASVYAVLLSKIAQQDEIYIATPVAGRPLPEMHDMPGMFVNTLPVITKPKAELSFAQLMQQVKTAALACQQNALCDISRIVEKLGIKRDPARNPIFDTMFVLQVKNLDVFGSADIGLEPCSFNRQRSQFDLSLEAIERGEEIVLKLDYATSLFRKETVLRIRDQFLNLVDAIVGSPGETIGNLSLLSSAQIEELTAWRPPVVQEQMRSISGIFDDIADQMQHKAALEFDGEAMSFAELNRRAHNLAFHMRAQGIGKGDYVCLLVERSFEMIVAILAVVKTGAAYVPIDPDYPDDRVAFTVGDCKAKLLITQPNIAQQKASLLETFDISVIEDTTVYQEGSHFVDDLNEVTDVLYVIYTSGTTGVPKGVMVEHRCLYSLLFANDKLNFYPSDRWVLFHSYAFDVSVWEIFASLLHGCTLLIPPKKVSRDTRAFREFVRLGGVTVLNQTPSAFYRFSEVEEACEDRLALRWINFAGEALLPGRLLTWRKKYPDADLINMYGITETTIHTSYKKLADEDIANGSCSNIGVSLDSLTIYLLDANRSPCAPGVIGEIYVGGWGVARGYLNRAELNEQRFLVDPFNSGGRMYKSGDLAKWTHTGELEYLGRNDHQVKIRGFRIECGEVENLITKLCEVKTAAVFDKTDARGDKYLCAVVQAKELSEEGVIELKSKLLTFLPAYMVPAQIVGLDQMPLTSNGKLDKRKLSRYMDRVAPRVEYSEPQTPAEQGLAQIWSRYFPKAGPISRNHDFFDLGGHSLMAIELVLDIKRAFDREVSLDVVFNASRLSELACHIESANAAKDTTVIPKATGQTSYLASEAQQRLFFIDQLDPSPGIAYNMPLIYEVDGAVDSGLLRDSLETLSSRHEALRTHFEWVDGEIRQVIGREKSVCFAVSEGDSRRSVMDYVGDFVRPFDLMKEPLFRAHLVQFPQDNKSLLFFDFHHSVCDGLSLNIFISEMNILLAKKPLGEAPVQYKDYCLWINDQPGVKVDEQYWLDQLRDVKPLDLYTDYPRASAQTFAGGEIRFTLGEEHSRAFSVLCKESKSTAYMTYMAVFSLLLSELCKQKDIVVGSPFAGRPHPDLQGAFGMFVSSLPIRCRLDGDLSFAEYVQAIKMTCLEAQEHPFLRLERIASRLGAPKEVARNPIFDCMLDMQVADPAAFVIPGALAKQKVLENPSAKMDLVLSIENCDAATGTTSCVLSYAKALFTEATANAIVQCFQRLADVCIASPSRPLSELAADLAPPGGLLKVLQREDNAKRLSEYVFKRSVSGAPEQVGVPTDRARGARQEPELRRCRFSLDGGLGADLSALSARLGSDIETTLMASWVMLLSRLSGECDIVVGEGNLEALRPVPGHFSAGQSVGSTIQRFCQSLRAAAQYEPLDLDVLTQALTRPLQYVFSWQNCLTSAQSSQCARSTLDMHLTLTGDRGGFEGEWAFAGALFDEPTIMRYIGHWMHLLEAMVADSERALGELPLLSEAERRQVLIEWNATARPYPSGTCVHERFEQQVEQSPEATALVFEGERLSYAALNQRANQLAHHLRAQGVAPGDTVALMMERSAALVVAELAVLKAGGTYVPLDQALPVERRAYIVGDCATRCIVARGPVDKAIERVDVQCIDVNASAVAEQATCNLCLDLPATAAAYVMYTSGSTGKPKGVVVSHQGINRLVSNNRFAELGSGDCVAFASNPAFDASTFELWSALLNGARLVVVPQAKVLNPAEFSSILLDEGVTTLFLTVGLFNQYHESLAEVMPRLRHFLTGGDALDARIVRKVLQAYPPQHFWNGYGPTEATTFATTCDVQLSDLTGNSVPIGRPIGNTSVYILDAYRQPVPVGVTGELYIGGPGVAQGYLNQPALTEERFIPDPFSAEPGARLYKTGDLGCWLPSGQIAFVGRNDFQVKIRGFRIELGDIEATLSALEGVDTQVVVVRESDAGDSGGDKQLVAYYTGPADRTLIREQLSQQLPPYMVPKAFVHLERLPLNVNGKVDRKALPAPESKAYASQGYEAPKGELEVMLSAIWAEVLQRPQVGRRDNFFDLGGHSLMAVSLIEKMRLKGISVDVQALFMAPDLAELAKHIEQGGSMQKTVVAPENLIPDITDDDPSQGELEEFRL